VLSYEVSRNVKVRVGADNVFDRYPAKAQWQSFRGLIYSRNTPHSTDGGYYYGRVEFKF
jgi:iron complex outermembrane receptor protein